MKPLTPQKRRALQAYILATSGEFSEVAKESRQMDWLEIYHDSIDITSAAFKVNSDPFYALIMAAARSADSDNMAKLEAAFPEVLDQLRRRYRAGLGILEGDNPATVNYYRSR